MVALNRSIGAPLRLAVTSFPSASSSSVISTSWKVHRSYVTQPSSSSSSSSSSHTPSSSQQSSPSAYEKQRRFEWLVIAVSGSVAAAGAYYWYQRRNQPVPTDFSMPEGPLPIQFAIPVRGPTGERKQKIITTLTAGEVDRKLRDQERSVLVSDEIPSNHSLVYRYDTNSVGSNDPIEDRRAEAIVDSIRRATPEGSEPKVSPADAPTTPAKGDLAFFAVMDGHSGFHTSTYLSNKLIAFVALELDKVFRETEEYAKIAEAKSTMPAKLWRALVGGTESSSFSRLDADPVIIRRALEKAFLGLDKEICNTPLQMLQEHELSSPAGTLPSFSDGDSENSHSLSSLAKSIFTSPGSSHAQTPLIARSTSAYESMLPALSGSCALLTYIDSLRNDIYVACTGDSRAIAGWFDPKDGKWTVEALSIDQTGRNPSEIKRMQGEHPFSEADTVIMRGRVLGNLEPTRAFGDARYKWTKDTQERLYRAFLPPGAPTPRPPPRSLLTPPYVTARPEVEWRRLPIAEGEKYLKFVVMATDGLWDMLSNEEVGTLVAGHLAELKGNVGASELERIFLASTAAGVNGGIGSTASTIEAANSSSVDSKASSSSIADPPKTEQQQPRPQGHHPLSGSGEHMFTFQDANLATHLVRNALGGADQHRLGGLLAIPAPDSRRYRDDITVNVILLNEPKSIKVAEMAAPSAPKSKL